MGRILGLLGGGLTLGYGWFLCYLLNDRRGQLKTMPLNEVGDFLAGAFGPLAILWLVLGYFQQGIELRQNSEALQRQATELENSVKQQENLASAARQTLQFQHEMAARTEQIERNKQMPKFVQQRSICTLAKYLDFESGISIEGIFLEIHAINMGNRCSQVRLNSNSNRSLCSVSEQFIPALLHKSVCASR